MDGVRAIAVDDAGALHAVTRGEHVTLSADGAELARVPTGGELRSAWVDASRGTVVGLTTAFTLTHSPDLAISAALQSGPLIRFETSEDGRAVTLDNGRIACALQAAGQVREIPRAQCTFTPRKWSGLHQALPLADGGSACVMRRTEDFTHASVLPPGPFDPPWADRYDHLTKTDFFVERLDSAGRSLWSSESLGPDPRVAVGADGALYAARNQRDGGASVVLLLEGGREVGLAQTDTPVRALYQRDGFLVAEHGVGVLKRTDDGQVVDIPVPPGWKPWGLLPDGRLFLVDGAKQRAALLYPSGGGPVADSASSCSLTLTCGDREWRASASP